jgi:hypothetical protein
LAFHDTQCSTELIPHPCHPSVANIHQIVSTNATVAKFIAVIAATARASPSLHASS